MKRFLAILIALLAPVPMRADTSARTVLVFPFENQSDRPDLNWIAEGLAEILSTRLTVSGSYALGKPERDAAYAQLGLPDEAPLTLASEFKVAVTLGVDWAVVGSFRVQENHLTARARLLDLDGMKISTPLEAAGELADLAELSTLLGWRLLALHDPQFTTQSEEDFRRRFREIRLDAFENYIRGLLSADDKARVQFWREAARLDPGDRRAAFALGQFYYHQKEYAKSAEWLRQLTRSDRNYLESMFLLAIDEYFIGHPAVAEQNFETVAHEIPLNEVTNNLGVVQARREQYGEALASFNRAYEAEPTDPDFAFNTASCLWYLKRYDETVKFLEQALRYSQEDAEIHAFLAATFGRLKRPNDVRRELEWLAEHDPPSDQPADLATTFFPQMRLKKNYDGRAFQLLSMTVSHAVEEKLASEPRAAHSQAHLELGKRLWEEKRLPEAERELAEAVSLLPGDSETHLALAQVYEAEGRHRDAVSELDSSLRLKASSKAHLLLAQIYLSMGQPENARSHGEAALALEPGNREAARLVDQVARSTPTPRKRP